MKRHLIDKGENWREDTILSEIKGPFGNPIKKRVATPVFLEELFQNALNTYLEEPTQDQRIDLANILGMLYLWEEGLAQRS